MNKKLQESKKQKDEFKKNKISTTLRIKTLSSLVIELLLWKGAGSKVI